MLIEHTLFGTVDKVANAIRLLKNNEPPEGYYLCFSGGKDSVVIHELATRAGVKFDAHNSITTVEPPELMRFIRDNYPNVIHDHPQLSMAQLIVKNKIPPLRTIRYCCHLLKEPAGMGRVKITGIRAEESSRRARRQDVEDSNDGKSSYVHPIRTWSKLDVWQFIHENNLPYCSLYDEGFDRIGCVLCPFESEALTKRDLQRFPAIADYYRRACRKSFEVNKGKFSYERGQQKWASGDDIFNWWISERKGRYVVWGGKCQLPLFADDDNNIV